MRTVSFDGCRKGLFSVLSQDFDIYVRSVDGSILQAHAKAFGSEKRDYTKASAAQRAGLTRKILAVGMLIRFVVLPSIISLLN